MGAERAAEADGVLLTMAVENQGSAALRFRTSALAAAAFVLLLSGGSCVTRTRDQRIKRRVS
ncbi:hypothetical protein THIX_30035 [Thiomonas sp. X19]|nr:hypothetical protein THIX_30035 [Thiomonas sp. X19]